MPKKGKGGKKLRDQIRQQKELEEIGVKNILLKKLDEVKIDEETGAKTIIISNEGYGKITRVLGSKRYEWISEESPGKPFVKRRGRKMGKLDHKNHRQKILVGDVILFYYDRDEKPDKNGFYGGEIFHKYSEREIVELVTREHISEHLWIGLKETDTEEFIPFQFENEEFLTKEQKKEEKLKKQDNGVYFDYNFDSDDDTTSPNLSEESNDKDELPDESNTTIDLDDI